MLTKLFKFLQYSQSNNLVGCFSFSFLSRWFSQYHLNLSTNSIFFIGYNAEGFIHEFEFKYMSNFNKVCRMTLTICFIGLLNLGSCFISTEKSNIYTEYLHKITRSIWPEVMAKAEWKKPKWTEAHKATDKHRPKTIKGFIINKFCQ